ncbi:carbohydrate-binding module family 50 protein, partial [Parathielavia hyrcaniae]
LLAIFRGDLLPNETDIGISCDPDCRLSLLDLQAVQQAACSSNDTILESGTLYPATYFTDLLLHTFDYACLQNAAGTEYCFPQYIEWNQNEEEEEYCNECNLGVWKSRLSSPFGWDDALFDLYTSLTACTAAPSWAVTSPSQYALGYPGDMPTMPSTTTSSRPRPTLSCQSNYTIQASDWCKSISRVKQVSTYNLMRVNLLPSYCNFFPGPGTTICIPETCRVHSVGPLDTCEKIANKAGVTTQQLISWNPNINPECSNLYDMLDFVICVGPLGSVATTTASYPDVPTAM